MRGGALPMGMKERPVSPKWTVPIVHAKRAFWGASSFSTLFLGDGL